MHPLGDPEDGKTRAEIAQLLGTPDVDDIEYPDDEEPTVAQIELGKILYFDRRLSKHQTMSCATCHNPDIGFGDGMAFGQGVMGGSEGRNAPHIYNLAWNNIFFWDGRAATLEEQALGPIQAEGEMNMPLEEVVGRIEGVVKYQELFKAAYGDNAITSDNIGRAIASFERTVVSDNSAFDRYLAGDDNALSKEAMHGMQLYVGKANCIECHSGPNLTDQSFHNLGMKSDDIGRMKVVEVEVMNKAFKTPGLRNVALTGPYMHDGSLGSLEDVVKFYNRGGDVKTQDPLMKPLGLTAEEERALIAFLGALTDPVDIAHPVVP
ncbi:MAG: hypothetical protein HRU15_08795 [Planctomycetes bacterium]|nr:hypothetical protein [Planctomycetota bacterium]